MPRWKARRRCRGHRGALIYKPAAVPLHQMRIMELQADQLEALRLCDAEDLTQEEAGKRMGVSRGTVQRLLSDARRIVARFLAEGTALEIVPTKNHPYSQ